MGVAVGELELGALVGLLDGDVEGDAEGAEESAIVGLAEGSEDNIDCITQSRKPSSST